MTAAKQTSPEVLLGVDGGNTKADFFLFAATGERLAHLRTGTCSHEALPGGYPAAALALHAGLTQVCAKAGILPEQIGYAVFGLAGADTAAQHTALFAITEALLPGKTRVCNDSMLGIRAGVPSGVGVCCINGTGASVSGIDAAGHNLQVGGIGHISSDYAGGGFAASEVLRCVYSARYRDAAPTLLTQRVLSLLNAPPNANLLELFHPDNLPAKKLECALDRLLFQCAAAGDPCAQEILHTMARTLAQSTAGCIKALDFEDAVAVVLAGSLWVKGGYPPMVQLYRAEVENRVGRPCQFVLLQEPPALGAILWAYEGLKKAPPPAALQQQFAAAVRCQETTPQESEGA